MSNHRAVLLKVSEYAPLEKRNALRYPPLQSRIFQARFAQNADIEFMARRSFSGAVILLGDLPDVKLKDSGINYQRVGVGMQEKGRSDLGERLLYEGHQESSADVMFWKGVDIDRYWIAERMNRFCRTNYRDFICSNEVVRLNVARMSDGCCYRPLSAVSRRPQR